MMVDLDLLRERAGLYRLLSALYAYPLTAELLTAVSQLAVAPDSPLAKGLLSMQAYLADHDDGLETLNVEMTRLLEGPGQPAAPPYASFYLFGGRLMGPPAQAARRAYLDWDVFPNSGKLLPDDHVALELGFLAYLAKRIGEDESSNEVVAILTASRDFIRQLLQPWLPLFCNALAESSIDPFFVGLADFTRTAVEADLTWLSTAILSSETRLHAHNLI